MKVHREDFRKVVPTDAEAEAFWKRNPHRRRFGRPGLPTRAEHMPCGARIWYVGLAIGSHMRACPGHS